MDPVATTLGELAEIQKTLDEAIASIDADMAPLLAKLDKSLDKLAKTEVQVESNIEKALGEIEKESEKS